MAAQARGRVVVSRGWRVAGTWFAPAQVACVRPVAPGQLHMSLLRPEPVRRIVDRTVLRLDFGRADAISSLSVVPR